MLSTALRSDGSEQNLLPDAIIQKVNADLHTVVALKEVQDQFHLLGTYTRDLTPAQTSDFIRGEEQLWWPIVRQVNEHNDCPRSVTFGRDGLTLSGECSG
jgi:hypothetical protein